MSDRKVTIDYDEYQRFLEPQKEVEELKKELKFAIQKKENFSIAHRLERESLERKIKGLKEYIAIYTNDINELVKALEKVPKIIRKFYKIWVLYKGKYI